MKKTIFAGLVLAFALLGLFSEHAQAGAAWYTCTVRGAGPNGASAIYIKLSDSAATPAFTNKFFGVIAGSENKMLATALTGMSIGKKVYIKVDPLLAGSPPIQVMYLLAD